MQDSRLTYTERYEYDGDGNVIYKGYARSESDPATGAGVWAIQKFTYTGGMLTLSQWANGDSLEGYSWDNRASYTYK